MQSSLHPYDKKVFFHSSNLDLDIRRFSGLNTVFYLDGYSAAVLSHFKSHNRSFSIPLRTVFLSIQILLCVHFFLIPSLNAVPTKLF